MPESGAVILIVDDREENRYVSSRILKNAGYAVAEATSGREALQKVLENPALVVLDVRLPDIIGYEVCRRIKSNPQTANIPVLQISASFVSSESRVQALDSGADAYLTQPMEPAVLLATVRALLRLREAEALSRLSAKQWQATFDALSEGIALIDSEWRVARCNRAMLTLFDKTYSQVENEDVRALLRRELNYEVDENELPRAATDIKRERRWFSLRLDPIREHEIAHGAILIITEITDRKVAEEALRVSERLAAMGRLANSIAHEINNPLEAITNLLYLLKTSTLDGESAQYVEMASAELERIARITKQTLAFNRNSEEPVDVELTELLDGVVTLFSPEFNRKGLHLVRKYDAPPIVSAFPGELRQVFANILRNALEATSANGRLIVHVRPSLDWKNLSRRGARIYIVDSGAGMTSETRHSLFEPFYTTKELKGSGLGLWLSLGIISKHRGRITVRSITRAGHSGSCFSIFLPVKTAEESAPLTKQNAVA